MNFFRIILEPAVLIYDSRGASFITLSRAQRAYHARIASELRFRFDHKSFYRFGIRLATSHNMTPSCILGFQATRAATWAHFIHPLFIVRWQIANISEANNRGLQTQQCPIGQVVGNPCRGRFNTERTVT